MDIRLPPRMPSAFESAELGRGGYFHSSPVAVKRRVKGFPIWDGQSPGEPGRSRGPEPPRGPAVPKGQHVGSNTCGFGDLPVWIGKLHDIHNIPYTLL